MVNKGYTKFKEESEKKREKMIVKRSQQAFHVHTIFTLQAVVILGGCRRGHGSGPRAFTQYLGPRAFRKKALTLKKLPKD